MAAILISKIQHFQLITLILQNILLSLLRYTLQLLSFLHMKNKQCTPLSACFYIQSPKDIQKKKAVLNFYSNAEKGFAYAVSIAL